jgi:hypothetical protein
VESALVNAALRVIVQHQSQQIFIRERKVPSFTSYDDVIKNRDAKQPTHFDQPSSDSTIFLRRLAVGRRVIVPTDD